MDFFKTLTTALGAQASASLLLTPYLGPARIQQEAQADNVTQPSEVYEDFMANTAPLPPVFDRSRPVIWIVNKNQRQCFSTAYEISLARKTHFKDRPAERALCEDNLSNMVPRIATCITKLRGSETPAAKRLALLAAYRGWERICEKAGMRKLFKVDEFIESAGILDYKEFYSRPDRRDLAPRDTDILSKNWYPDRYAPPDIPKLVEFISPTRESAYFTTQELKTWLWQAFWQSPAVYQDLPEAYSWMAHNAGGVMVEMAREVVCRVYLRYPTEKAVTDALELAYESLKLTVADALGLELESRFPFKLFRIAGPSRTDWEIFDALPEPVNHGTRWDKFGRDMADMTTNRNRASPGVGAPWQPFPPADSVEVPPGPPGGSTNPINSTFRLDDNYPLQGKEVGPPPESLIKHIQYQSNGPLRLFYPDTINPQPVPENWPPPEPVELIMHNPVPQMNPWDFYSRSALDLPEELRPKPPQPPPDIKPVPKFSDWLEGVAPWQWFTFGSVSIAVLGIGLGVGLGLSHSHHDELNHAYDEQRKREQVMAARIEMNFLSTRPDIFMASYNNLTWGQDLSDSLVYYSQYTAAGGVGNWSSIPEPFPSIVQALWGKDILLQVATCEWSIQRVVNWLIPQIGHEMWKALCELADIAYNGNTEGDIIYRYLVAQSAIRTLESAVTWTEKHGPQPYPGIEETLSEIATALGITRAANLLDIVDPKFGDAYRATRADIYDVGHNGRHEAAEKMGEIICLYRNGKAGPMLQYGIRKGFNKPNDQCKPVEPPNTTASITSTASRPSTTSGGWFNTTTSATSSPTTGIPFPTGSCIPMGPQGPWPSGVPLPSGLPCIPLPSDWPTGLPPGYPWPTGLPSGVPGPTSPAVSTAPPVPDSTPRTPARMSRVRREV